jgi:hypothetical protein
MIGSGPYGDDVGASEWTDERRKEVSTSLLLPS